MEIIMAVDSSTNNVDLNSLLKGVDMGNVLGGGNNADGLGGGVLLGLLLGRSGILGNNEVGAAAAAAHILTAADVQNIVNGNANSQTLGNIEGEIWKAEGQLQGQLLAQSNTAQIATLNAEIANLQGQAGILAAIANNSKEIINEVHEGSVDTMAGINLLSSGVAAGFNSLNTNVLQGTYATTQAITNDGDKTRALIQSIETANLNREITVAQNEISNLRHHDAVAANGINVTNNINQTATAVANATAQQQIVGLLGTVAASLQHNTQSVVNLGSMIGSPQTATNVRT
jgi:hypothetical protein